MFFFWKIPWVFVGESYRCYIGWEVWVIPIHLSIESETQVIGFLLLKTWQYVFVLVFCLIFCDRFIAVRGVALNPEWSSIPGLFDLTSHGQLTKLTLWDDDTLDGSEIPKQPPGDVFWNPSQNNGISTTNPQLVSWTRISEPWTSAGARRGGSLQWSLWSLPRFYASIGGCSILVLSDLTERNVKWLEVWYQIWHKAMTWNKTIWHDRRNDMIWHELIWRDSSFWSLTTSLGHVEAYLPCQSSSHWLQPPMCYCQDSILEMLDARCILHAHGIKHKYVFIVFIYEFMDDTSNLYIQPPILSMLSMQHPGSLTFQDETPARAAAPSTSYGRCSRTKCCQGTATALGDATR